MFEESINLYIADLHKNNVQINFIGDLSPFSQKLLKNIKKAEALTKNNNNLKLNFAINYGGKWDIINSINKMIHSESLDGKTITSHDFEQFLSLKGSSPDLLIRTAGYQRLSNFMLWQHAYTELYFTDCLWPDFDEKELDLAINHYFTTTRKFGKLDEYNPLLEEDAE